ncbi:HlyD family efflux transporter periplasmic adaptor subunit, partial [Acinetobacter baumannii]
RRITTTSLEIQLKLKNRYGVQRTLTDQVYVEANFREIELKQIKIGQPVTVYVDAYNVELKGVVDSFSPSTGAFFSPISATNATGNFTKIVQRLPLRIKLLENQPDIKLLRPGLSVVVSVDTTKK